MPKVATKRAKVAVATNDAQTIDMVNSILKVASPEKVMRSFNRTRNDNMKLDKFLSANFSVPKSFQAEHVASEIDKLINPKNHEHHGLINIERQRELLDLLTDKMVGVEVASKTAWLASFNLTDEQQIIATSALTKYRATLSSAIKQVSAWKQVYGG